MSNMSATLTMQIVYRSRFAVMPRWPTKLMLGRDGEPTRSRLLFDLTSCRLEGPGPSNARAIPCHTKGSVATRVDGGRSLHVRVFNVFRATCTRVRTPFVPAAATKYVRAVDVTLAPLMPFLTRSMTQITFCMLRRCKLRCASAVSEKTGCTWLGAFWPFFRV